MADGAKAFVLAPGEGRSIDLGNFALTLKATGAYTDEAFIYIPKGLVHSFRVGKKQSRKLNLYSPAAMVGYFDELSAP